jgi:hypothetical protein
MGAVTALLVYGVIGVALASALLWYVQTLWQRFAPTKINTTPLGEMRVVGKDEATAAALANLLPGMVVAQLEDLKRRWNTTSEVLAELGQAPTFGDLGAGRSPTLERLQQPADISFKIAEVEIGGLLSWLAQQERPTDTVDVTVLFGGDDRPARVFGLRAGAEGHAWSVASPTDLPSVVQTIAASIWQHEVGRREAVIDMISGPDFAEMVHLRTQFAILTRRYPQDRSVDDEQRNAFKALLKRLGTKPHDHPGWPEMQELAAQIAEKAEDWAAARAAYSNLLSITPPDDKMRAGLLARAARMDENLRAAAAEAEAAAARPEAPEAAVAAEQSRTRGAAAEPPPPRDPRIAALRALIGLAGEQSATSVRIGVVGPVPWAEVRATANVEFVGEAPTTPVDQSYADYITSLLQAVRVAAADPIFVFAPMPSAGVAGSSAEALRANIEALVAAKVDVLLVTYGSPQPMPAINAVLAAAAPTTITVMAAGNNGSTSNYAGLAKVGLVAASVNTMGARSSFTNVAPDCVWAPGEQVPLVSPRTGQVEVRDGTSYSAALVGGAAAILRHSAPNATAAQIRQALVETSLPVEGRSEPPIINVDAALEWLAKRVGAT